ncbi:MAG TPA: SAM-dependent chlorinase/fluorinase [Acidimicrobiales bacterium]|nr:SAM-dependent chlorinase/fluorinase [Acidimicrobiales bacterium]
MASRLDTVSFLSDYGLQDEFVGVVTSVIRGIASHVTVVDVTHGVPAHDVRAGGLALARAAQYLAPGVVLAVVDPGVGTDRRAVAVEVGDREAVFVGPDNGVLASAVAMVGGARAAVELTDPAFHLPAPGPTFAGRDVFAPVAAHLCNGAALADLGEAVDPAQLLPGVLPVSRMEAGKLVAEVLWVDRYGNVQLNVGPDEIEPFGEPVAVELPSGVRSASRADAYGAIAPGALGLVVDSYGLVSIAADRRPVAAELELGPGDAVILAPAEGGDGTSAPPGGHQGHSSPVSLRSRPPGRP